MPSGNSPRVILYDQNGDFPLVGSQAVSGSIPVSIANDQTVQVSGTLFTIPAAGVTGSITGSVGLSGPVAVSNFPATQNVSSISGSITGLLVGGLPVSALNPVPTQGTAPAVQNVTGSAWTPTITGSVVVSNQVNVTGSVGITAAVTVLPHSITSGSVTGLLVGGLPVSFANQVPVTGSVGLAGPVAVSNFPAVQVVSASSWIPTVTGSVGIAAPVAVLQGTVPWVVSGSNWVPSITGSITVINQVNVTGSNWTQTVTGSMVVANRVDVTGSNWIGVIAGQNGTNFKTIQTDTSGNLITTTQAAAASTNGFAYGTVVTTATTAVPLRETTYTEQTASFRRSIASANAADSSAGTGAQQVTITYYDYDFSGPFTETISLSGTTGNNTLNANICFIEKMTVARVGSGGVTAGIVSLFQSTAKGGGTIGTIAAGDNQTFWAHHYVPSGKTTYITSYYGNNDNGSNNTLFSIKGMGSGSTAPLLVITDAQTGGGGGAPIGRTFGTPVTFVGPGRVIMYGQPAGTPSITSRGSFDFYER